MSYRGCHMQYVTENETIFFIAAMEKIKRINRMTFYYHFKDIFDLVEWACLEDVRRVLQQKIPDDTWQQGFLRIFAAVQKNKTMVMNVYCCIRQEQVKKCLKPLLDRLVLKIICEESRIVESGMLYLLDKSFREQFPSKYS